MAELKLLQNTIVIDDDTYGITAKTAETAAVAEQLINAITFKKVNLTDSESSLIGDAFDGSSSKELVIVPAAGGRFTGRIAGKSFETLPDDASTILNYGDIEKFIVNRLNSSSVLYTWNGTELSGIGTEDGIQNISIITGANDDVSTLAEHINDKKPVAAYVYICNDDGNKGRMYFGTSRSDKVAGVEISAENALTAVNAANAEKLTNNADASEYYDYNAIKKLDETIRSDLQSAIETAATNIQNEITKITAGQTKVQNAVNADTAITAISATKDSNNNIILVLPIRIKL